MAKTTKGRVLIPRNVEESLKLAQTVYEKHKSDDSSLLKNIDGLDWAVIGPKISECLQKHTEAEELKRKMEEAYRDRDLVLPEIVEILRVSKSLLKAAYSKKPKKLGEWGFTVDDTPKTKKEDK
jgi:hypothetical protein